MPIEYKKAYEDLIANQIIVWLWSNVYKDCFEILEDNTLQNDASAIREALLSGSITYTNGVFVLNKRISNKLAVELEAIGAKYSAARKGYVLSREKLPTEVIWAIDTAKARTAAKALALREFLGNQLGDVDKIVDKLVFDAAVKAIMADLQKRVYKNAAVHKIQLISPKIDDFMATEIAQNYTTNLKFWIKQWLPEEMIKMREMVGQMAIEGRGKNEISRYIEKEFGVGQRKAQFLARNETAIATTSYLRSKYTAEGFTHFKWHVRLDGRERDWHKTLGTVGADGKGNVYRFDDPPIINEKTGQKGLPGEDYNCRCSMSPVITREFLQARRKRASNSLVQSIRNYIKQCLKKKM